MIAIRKLLSAVAAASLLATGSLAGAASLGGAQTLPTAAAQVDSSVIPAFGNLHVHKRIGVPTGVRDSGSPLESVPGDEAPGVSYDVYWVQDLESLADYQSAADVTVEDALADIGPETIPSATEITNAQGTAEFDDLARGLYLVVEEDNPVTNGQAISPAAPFLVAVPLTNPETPSQWLDTVHVYPKGQTVAAGTVVKEANNWDIEGNQVPVNVGERFSYSITAQSPTYNAEVAPISGFSVTDKLPAELGVPAVQNVTVDGDTVTDFDFLTWEVEGQNVLLVQLETPASGAEVVVTFDAEIGQTPPATLNNTAWASPTDLGVSDGWDPVVAQWDPEGSGPNPGTASNTTRSIYGQIDIIKTAQGDETQLLPGATFELHRCTAEGALTENSGPIAVGAEGQTFWTTGVDGPESISGIHLANVQNQATLEGYVDLWAGNGTQFCLVETQAPEGYELLPAPVLVTMRDYDENTVQLVKADQPIENVEANVGSQLPLTGGIGIWAILGIGVLLLLAAAAYYLANRKRDA